MLMNNVLFSKFSGPTEYPLPCLPPTQLLMLCGYCCGQLFDPTYSYFGLFGISCHFVKDIVHELKKKMFLLSWLFLLIFFFVAGGERIWRD